MGKKVLFTASTRIHFIHFHIPYLQAFRELGWQVDVACGNCSEDVPGADHTIVLPLEKKMSSPSNFTAAWQIRRRIKEEKYDLLICHTSLAAFFSRLAVMGLRNRPRVCNMVHGYLFDDGTSALKRTVLSLAETLTAPVTDLILTMNDYDTRYARKHRLAKKVEFVNGIGLDEKKLGQRDEALRREFRQQLGMQEDDFLLLYAAEFSGRKDQQTLIRGLPELDSWVKLLLPGRGDLLESCKELARSLEIEDRVIFPGYDSEMKKWYMAADCAVSSSRCEGLPFNIMEAMHFSLPIVATAVKGNTDLIQDGKNGLLFPFGDSVALAQQLRRIVGDPQLAARLGNQAHKDVAKRYQDRVLPEVMQQYLSE